jgi:gluconate kinase
VPFLLTRLGDGEALAMRSVGVHDPTEKANVPWVKHPGYIPSDADKAEWMEMTRATVMASDVVGLHCTETAQHDYAWSCASLKEDLGDLIRETCSADIHMAWLIANVYPELVREAKGVVLVTGHHALSSRFATKFHLSADRVHNIILPLQSRYFGGVTPWSEWRDRIIPGAALLGELPGWLVLVGGGIPGKAMLGVLKRVTGGVVLDIGSVFDWWAGICTRGKGRGNPSSKWRL